MKTDGEKFPFVYLFAFLSTRIVSAFPTKILIMLSQKQFLIRKAQSDPDWQRGIE